MEIPIIYIQTHPIQYAAPFFKECTEAGLDIEVWFCYSKTLEGTVDKQFGTVVKWDVPLLKGYKYKFFSNSSWKPGIETGFWGLFNVSLLKALRKAPRSLVVIHGWNYATTLFSLLLAKRFGHIVALRGESPLTHELTNGGLKLALRKLLFKKVIFKLVNYFLYIGTRNKEFYQYYGIPDDVLYFAPHAVDNKRFSTAYYSLKDRKEEIIVELGYNTSKKTIIFSGKLTEKKRPMDLLRAFQQLTDPHVQLIFVGDGILRNQMEQYIEENNLKNVYITGFINQNDIVKYYSIADIFVMRSGLGETWGLSVNEAMNFNLPIIISDITGCSIDLVKQDVNGYQFKWGEINELAKALQKFTSRSSAELEEFGQYSSRTVSQYSFSQTIETLKRLSGIRENNAFSNEL